MTDDPALAAAAADTLTRFYRHQIDAGNIQAMTDLGDPLRCQHDLDGARAAYQQVDLGHLLMIFHRDYAGAGAYFRQAISSAHPIESGDNDTAAPYALVITGQLLEARGDTVVAQSAFQRAADAGYPYPQGAGS